MRWISDSIYNLSYFSEFFSAHKNSLKAYCFKGINHFIRRKLSVQNSFGKQAFRKSHILRLFSLYRRCNKKKHNNSEADFHRCNIFPKFFCRFHHTQIQCISEAVLPEDIPNTWMFFRLHHIHTYNIRKGRHGNHSVQLW